jgi:hypothetical protein
VRTKVFLASLAAVGFATASPDACADVTSWLAVGGGYALQRDRRAGYNNFDPTMTYSLGVGSSPLSSVVFGGVVRGTTFFGLGTDLGVSVRACTGGFARGTWGGALELGGIWRYWRQGDFGEWPLQAVVTLGSPWGFQLAAGTEFASLDGARAALGGFAVLELDLLRLTVMRQGDTERWWYNPSPAGGHAASASASADRD